MPEPQETQKTADGRLRRWSNSLIAWASPRALWAAASKDGKGKNSVAAGFGLGVFIANTPLWGAHSALAIVSARLLRLHPITVLAGTLVATPPIGPVLIAAAIWLGGVVLHGHAPHLEELDPHKIGYRRLLELVAWEWTVGSTILGIAMAITAFTIIRLALRGVHSAKAPVTTSNPDVPQDSR